MLWLGRGQWGIIMKSIYLKNNANKWTYGLFIHGIRNAWIIFSKKVTVFCIDHKK